MDDLRTSTVIWELERIYSSLADEFGKRLQGSFSFTRPLITIQSRGRQNALGWYSHNRWSRTEEGVDGLAEINICAENLHQNPIETLVHEMVHYSNAFNGIRDCSSNQYHNKRFAETAVVFGLTVEKSDKHGYAHTEISPALQDILDNVVKPDYGVLDLYRKSPSKMAGKAPTKMKKFSCGCTNVRCAVALDAVCGVCGGTFERVV